jgi:hypothetical protein
MECFHTRQRKRRDVNSAFNRFTFLFSRREQGSGFFSTADTYAVGIDLSGDAVLIIIEEVGAKALAAGLGLNGSAILAAGVGILDDRMHGESCKLTHQNVWEIYRHNT